MRDLREDYKEELGAAFNYCGVDNQCLFKSIVNDTVLHTVEYKLPMPLEIYNSMGEEWVRSEVKKQMSLRLAELIYDSIKEKDKAIEIEGDKVIFKAQVLTYKI